MPGISVTLVRGTSRDFPFQAKNPDGSIPVGLFQDTDTLATSVWSGASEPAVMTPATTWSSATNAQFVISFQNADSANLASGIYFFSTFATRTGSPTRTAPLLPPGSTIEILATTGVAALRPSYITTADVRKIAPWIEDLQVPDSHMGFDEQLADSREWLDELVLRNYRGGNVSLLGMHGYALDAWYTGGGRRTSLTNRWLKDQLVANHLLVTPRVKKICAHYALSLICESMMTKNNQYLSMAARFRFEAETLLACSVVEIDVNGDGYGEIPVNFSSTNTLWA